MSEGEAAFPKDAPDVLVIGGGAAGVVAAVAAARRGKRVVLLKKAEGATGMSSGAVDVADDQQDLVPGPDADPLSAGGSVVEAMARLAAKRPRHPYARLGGSAQRMPEALRLLGDVAADVELSAREDGKNRVLATQLGTTKRAALAQGASAVDLSTLDASARLRVVDLEDLGGFGATPVAGMLSWIAGLGGHELDVCTVSVRRLPGLARPFENGRQMAVWLDDDEHAATFIESVGDAVKTAKDRPTHLLFPAVLGVAKTASLLPRLEEATGCRVAELLALPQSAPGARLSRALVAGAEREGVRVLQGEALAGERACGRITVVEARVRGEKKALRPGAVVLASGRFFAGGLVRDGYAVEPVFGLPVVTDGEPVGERFIGSLTGDRPEQEHAIFRAGLAYDGDLRPLDERERPFAENLFAAGSVLEGYDPARDGSGLGVAALTGLLAGERAADA